MYMEGVQIARPGHYRLLYTFEIRRKSNQSDVNGFGDIITPDRH